MDSYSLDCAARFLFHPRHTFQEASHEQPSYFKSSHEGSISSRVGKRASDSKELDLFKRVSIHF